MYSRQNRYSDFSKNDSKRKLKIPKKLDTMLCEFIGMYLGDGYIGCREGNKYSFEMSGHQIKDNVYYQSFVRKLLKKLFNIKSDPRYFLNSTFGYRIYSKGLTNFVSKRFNFKMGKKKTIKIPKEFFKDRKFLISCLRGIIDTDFYISFDDKFPELGGWFSSKSIVKDLEKSFNLFNFKVKTNYDTKYFDKRTEKFYKRHQIRLRGKNNLDKWFSLIGTHHPVLYTKYIHSKNGIYLKDKDITSNREMLNKAPIV